MLGVTVHQAPPQGRESEILFYLFCLWDHSVQEVTRKTVKIISAALAERSNSVRSIIYGSLAGMATSLGGAALAAFTISYETGLYGLTLFCLVPVVSGFAVACFVGPFRVGLLTVVICYAFVSVVLISLGLEGMSCVVMATPLILLGAILGALCNWALRKRFKPQATLLVFPLIGLPAIFGGGQVEQRVYRVDRIEEVTSTRVVGVPAEKAWETLIAAGHISGRKPLLLRIGLPVPIRCTLEGTGVGAKRTCYFDSGFIEERITAWDPPNSIEMKIVRSTLPGRHWLGFETVSYQIERLQHQSLITRTTTISSKLRPAWYWRFFERMGVEAEHRYLFDALFDPAQQIPATR